MATKPRKSRGAPANMSLLKPEDTEELRKQARASVLAEMTQAARDEFFQKALAEARAEHVPADQIVSITIDVAPFIPYIALDGVQFFHGYTYQVPRKQFAVIIEQMQRSWLHQDEI